MPKYEVDIPHSLTPAEAKQRIAGATGKLESDYGAACVWKNDMWSSRGRAREAGKGCALFTVRKRLRSTSTRLASSSTASDAAKKVTS